MSALIKLSKGDMRTINRDGEPSFGAIRQRLSRVDISSNTLPRAYVGFSVKYVTFEVSFLVFVYLILITFPQLLFEGLVLIYATTKCFIPSLNVGALHGPPQMPCQLPSSPLKSQTNKILFCL